jgi:hypothetical protein
MNSKDKLISILKHAATVEGGHHKQWYILNALKELCGIDWTRDYILKNDIYEGLPE